MHWDDLIFGTFQVFIGWPAGAFLPAAVFALVFAWNRRAVTLVPAVAWAAYATLECLNKARITCSGECNVRIDLIVIYPLLWIVSAAGVLGLFMGRKCRADARRT